MAIGPKFAKENTSTRNGSFMPFGAGDRSGKLEKILGIIRDNYVDPVKLDTLQHLAIKDILKKLDPHSAYLPPEDKQQQDEDLDGSFTGIGIEYYVLQDTLLVTSVTPGGPASHSALRQGDRIIAIDQTPVAGNNIATSEISRLIRGANGSTVDLVVKNARYPDGRKVTITRGNIDVSSIDVAYMLDRQTGYVKITRFGAQTDRDFTTAIKKLQKSGMKNLVLDLRDNGGGYLSAATALADEFLSDKKLIVYTEGEHEPRTDYLATSEGSFEEGGLVVLINENSASASEIVAGAIQDLDRGTIIGRRSFGKGLVQEQFPFGDGSALNLTIARYYTPLGRSIQRSYKKGSDAYYEEVGNRFRNGEVNSDGHHYQDSTYSKEKSFKTASGRIMYGGGGIMPDIYVPLDTAGYTDFYSEIAIKGFLNDFIYRNLLRSATTPVSLEEFVHNYQVDERDYQHLLSYAGEKGVKTTENISKASKPVIISEMKAILARYFFGEDGYYRVINSGDKALVRSLELMNKDKKLVSYRDK
ncbi:S41 family peptidase [Hufsiella ginkgonis]|nr:S41 family peptidase [Hufsiella ginkgonis]